MSLTLEETINAVKEHGGIRPAARALGVGESTLRMRIKRATVEVLAEPEGEQHSFSFTSNRPLRPLAYEPMADRPRYFIFSSAQDSTDIHDGFVAALKVYAEWLENCEIMISGFTYAKTLFEDHDTRSSKVGFHPAIDDYIVHDRIRVGDLLDFCGEMNTLPTAVTPLSGFKPYTRDRWGIFPHPKVQLESVPTMKGERSKQNMTTGAVTLPNYIRKKAGIKASFDHICGAVLVELAEDGSVYCRHLIATSHEDGSFYDLDRLITPEGVTEGHRVEALTYGDIHAEKLDPVVAMTTWNYDVETRTHVPGGFRRNPTFALVDFLRPHFQFFHDLSDFTPRNHHAIGDVHFRFKMHKAGTDNVEAAMRLSADFLRGVERDGTLSVVVESNHDQAFVKWLKTADYRTDPENARFFLKWQHRYLELLEEGNGNPPVFEEFLRECGIPDDVTFIDEDTSFTICGNIECSMHGHRGPNGSRAGGATTYAAIGAKSNTAHTHSPAIIGGAAVAGVSGKLDMGYNVGMSSWSHSHILTYPNAKRTILTMMNGRWYA